MPDSRKPAPFAELGELFADALARADMVPKALPGNPSEVSRLVNGHTIPSHEKLERWSELLGLDAGLVLLWRLVGRYRSRSGNGSDEVLRVLTAAARAREAEVRRPGLARLRFTAVICGDRRRDPVSVADLTVDDASPLDLGLLPSVPLREGAPLLTDRLVLGAPEPWRRERLQGDVLVVGSPAVNLVARAHNARSTFGFASPASGELASILRDAERLGDRPRELANFRQANHGRLQTAIAATSSSGYRDPVAGSQAMRHGAWTDGCIGVSRSPWNRSGRLVFAAGRTGAGTLAALHMLGARPELFRRREVGFVFEMQLPGRRAPDHEVFALVADAEPTTPAYALDDPKVAWPDPEVVRNLARGVGTRIS